ncbi:hypothetical protein [Salipaludibacillus sp. CF4.18]|uniref:hypothetical protein n=1 Tax=Salipaludibacillus sp. CF4.18 TaxID=3373081 RepID=UPI003EE736B0
MVENILFLVLFSLIIFLYDFPKLKQTNRKDRLVYGIMILPILYLSLIFVLDLGWPTLNDLFHIYF